MSESYSGAIRRQLGENASKGTASRAELHDAVDALLEGLGALSERIKALEAREDAFKGAHQRAQSYRKGDFVTRSGSLWCALQDVPDGKLPGSEPELWQLAAKGHER